MSLSIRHRRALLLLAIGVLGATVGPLAMKSAMDISLGASVLSRNFIAESPLTSGHEVEIEVSGGKSPVMLEFIVKTNASLLDTSDTFVVRTPFKFSYECFRASGDSVYSGATGTLSPTREQVTMAGAENSLAEIIERFMVYRAIDMGPFTVKASLSSTTDKPYSAAVLRIYDDIPSASMRIVGWIGALANFLSPLCGLLGFFWFLLLTRAERRSNDVTEAA